MKHTMLTTSTLTRFEKLVDINTLTEAQTKEAEHDAYCANMGAESKEAAWDWFKHLMEMRLNIDLDALEAAQNEADKAVTA